MKQAFWPILFCAVCAAGLVVSGFAAAPASQPVYFFLSTTIDDHVNTDITADRLQRVLAMLGKYRAHNPSVGETLLFSGAMSAQLERQNGENRLLDAIKTGRSAGAVSAGYDGSGEPTYKAHPAVDLKGLTSPETRWNARVTVTDTLLTAARDPLTGAALPTGSGGLKKMQEVFGPASYIKGVFLETESAINPVIDVGVDSEIVHALRRYNSTAVMEGIADPSFIHPGPADYRGWADALSRFLSPDADTSPELFWHEGILRSSEDGGTDVASFRATAGVDRLKAMLAAIDRSRVRILHIEIGSQMNHVKPQPGLVRPNVPLSYAYDHPDRPQYPAELRLAKAAVDANYANEDAVLNYLVSEFLPANAGSRFVSPADLKSLTMPAWGYDVRMDALRPAVDQMVTAWGGKVPPKFLRVEDHYLSEADLFAVLADALAQMHRTGKLPVSVRVPHVYGPISTVQAETQVIGQVSAASVARVCARLNDDLHNDSWTPIPRNAVPSDVSLEGLVLNPAQFLRLMAEALIAESPEAKLTAKPTDLFWGREAVFYRRRPVTELGEAWTFKPAPLIGRP